MTTRSLFAKYNVPGPRYTSYPTVPYWEAGPTADEWIESLRRRIEAPTFSGAAIYVHIPFCERLCTYCGCNTRIARNRSGVEPYIQAVLAEWGHYRARLGSQLPVSDFHLGGGTPTYLTPDELARLLDGLLASVVPVRDAEFSLEADPRVTSELHLSTLAARGFRRVSLGVQDFDPKVQETVNRVQAAEQVEAVTTAARRLGYTSVNFDLIYGLPFQTLASVRDTITTVARLRPDRIAFYAYAHVPWIKAGQRRFTEDDLPTGDSKRALYETGRELLEAAGYREIGMDHFALESDALWKAATGGELHRNFMGYLPRRVDPLIGLGVSAIGDSWTAFAQNEKQLETYVERVSRGELPLLRGHVLTDEDRALRARVLELMTRFGTSWDLSADAARDHLATIPDRLGEMARDGLVVVDQNRCQVTEAGRPFLRNVCMAFDARLGRKSPSTQLFSRTL